MQIRLTERTTISGVAANQSPPIDVSGMSQFTFSVTVHTVSGTTPTLALQWQTSDNLQDWTAVNGTINQDAAGTTIGSIDAKTDSYCRYVRASIALGGTDPIYNYSLFLNTFASS